MELILGRENDEQMSRFVVIKQGRIVETIGDPGSVPKTVSCADAINPASKLGHIKLVIDDNNNTVTVVKSKNNPVYVNGHEIEKKVIDPFNDRLELGRDRWVMPLSEIADKYIPKVYDMTHLLVIWDKYDEEQKSIQNKIQKKKITTKNLKGSPLSFFPLISIILIVIMFIFSLFDIQDMFSTFKILFYLIIILLNLILLIFSRYNSDYTSLNKENDNLKQHFVQNYVCPSCKRFLGNTPYELLRNQYKKCPGCQVKFSW